MNTIIEKIRAEIKIRLSANGAFDEEGDSAWHYDQGLNDAYNYILSFLSDLEKECEKPTIQEQPVKIDIRKELESIEFMGVNDARNSETPKDLESYAQKVEDYYDVGEERGYLCVQRGEVKDAVIAGAKWQAEKDVRGMYMSDNRHFEKVYQLGRTDMREQMMKEAVDAEVCIPNAWVEHKEGKELVVRSEISKELGFKFGQKVKIIIVKED